MEIKTYGFVAGRDDTRTKSNIEPVRKKSIAFASRRVDAILLFPFLSLVPFRSYVDVCTNDINKTKGINKRYRDKRQPEAPKRDREGQRIRKVSSRQLDE